MTSIARPFDYFLLYDSYKKTLFSIISVFTLQPNTSSSKSLEGKCLAFLPRVYVCFVSSKFVFTYVHSGGLRNISIDRTFCYTRPHSVFLRYQRFRMQLLTIHINEVAECSAQIRFEGLSHACMAIPYVESTTVTPPPHLVFFCHPSMCIKN